MLKTYQFKTRCKGDHQS